MRAASFVLHMVLTAAMTPAGTITLSTDIELPAPDPDPNQVITVFIHSDAPILFMDLLIRVNGDATIEEVMDETTCGLYGWDANSIVTCTVNPDNTIQLFALNFNQNAAETVGYLQFRCRSGFVAVYLDTEESRAVGWTENFTFSDEPTSVGTLTLPPLIERNEPTFAANYHPAEGRCPDNDPCDMDWGPLHPRLFGETMTTRGYGDIWGYDLPPLPVIEINSDITENQVWTPDHYYRITRPVNVQALLVIEPGTFVFCDWYGMAINNGGTLISQGTPDNPVVYTSSARVEEVGWHWTSVEGEGLFQYCPIIVQSTASPATKISYSFIESSIYGVIVDNIRLDSPIENSYLCGNRYGVYELGPKLTDLRNNLFFYSGLAAIEVYPTTDPNIPADTDNILRIENNTLDYNAMDGIFVEGVQDPNAMPKVLIADNIISRCWFNGIVLYNGWLNTLITHNGYYDNIFNKAWDFQEFDPVIIEWQPDGSAFPFEYPIGEQFFQHHWLVPDCNFVDAGTDYVTRTTLVGKTTSIYSAPDTGMIDLGFHHMDWTYTGAGGIIGTTLDHVTTCADYWLCYSPFKPDSPSYIDPNLYIFDPNHPENWIGPNSVTFGGDWDDNGVVDLQDFAIVSQLWQAAPAVPDLVPVIAGEPDEGWVTIAAGQPNDDTMLVYAYVDGKYIRQAYAMGSDTPKYYDLTESGEGPHEIKFIAMDSDGNFSHSQPFVYEPNEPLPLHYCIVPSTYEPNQPLHFAAYNPDGAADITVNVYGYEEEPVWSQTFTGNTVKGQIPADITKSHYLTGVQLTSSGGGASLSKQTARYEPEMSPPDPNVIALIVLPDRVIARADRKIHAMVIEAFDDQGIKYEILASKNATFANVKKYAPQIKYLYLDAHGSSGINYGQNGVLRTSVSLADVGVVSAKASDFVTPPAWCKDPLPGPLETTLPSFAAMGFKKLRLFHFDGCLGAHLTIDNATGLLKWGAIREQEILEEIPHNDMSLACGMANGNWTESRFYLGWFNESESHVFFGQSYYQLFSTQLWSILRNGGTLFIGICDAKNVVRMLGGSATDENSPIKNFRLKGEGDIETFRLSSIQE